jgi:RNA polymerase sigma-70 factor (ECF subfamily)
MKPSRWCLEPRCGFLVCEVEESTMDVYSHVWRTAESYDPQRGGVLSWKLSIARSRAIDRLRSRARQQRASEGLYFECSSAGNTEEYIVGWEAKKRLHHALQALPLEQRQTIELAYFSGYSMTEVAARLGHPVATVKSRVRYGLIRMRRLMATSESHKP